MSILQNCTAALGRLLLASLFIYAGLGKMIRPAETISFISSEGLPLPSLVYFMAIVVEVIGGVFLAVGYHTRLTALVIALFALATAVVFHTQFSDHGQLVHFLKNSAIAGGLLQIVAFGGGSISLDAKRRSV